MSTQKLGGAKKIIGKIGKRNIVIICSVLLIGLAVYLNYIWFYDPTGLDYGNDDKNGSDDVSGDVDDKDDSNYFSSTQLSRQQARDEAIEVLQTVVSSETATAATKDKALEDIARIALEIENEAAVEALVMAKGFEQCVAVINKGAVSIVVMSDGLLPSQIAQIKEIVYTQTGILPSEVNIIPRSSK